MHFSPAHSPSRRLGCDEVHSTEKKAFWVLLSKEKIANNKKKKTIYLEVWGRIPCYG